MKKHRLYWFLPLVILAVAGGGLLFSPSQEPLPASEAGELRRADRAEDSKGIRAEETELANSPSVEEETARLHQLLDNGPEEEALVLARELSDHADRFMRMRALLAMQWIGGSAAYDIAHFLNDADPDIRKLADEAFADAVEDLEDPRLQAMLLQRVLESADPEKQMLVLEELAFLPPNLSFPLMASMLSDPDSGVQELARDNLEFIAGESFSTEDEAMNWFDRNQEEIEFQSDALSDEPSSGSIPIPEDYDPDAPRPESSGRRR